MHFSRELGVIVLAIAALVSGCEGETGPGETGDGEGAGAPDVDTTFETFDERPCPEDSELTFESFGGPFLITWCNGCHASGMPEAERQGAPLGIDFDDIGQIRAQAERIWSRSADHNITMPPAGGPEDDDRALLGEWLACGAPSLEDD